MRKYAVNGQYVLNSLDIHIGDYDFVRSEILRLWDFDRSKLAIRNFFDSENLLDRIDRDDVYESQWFENRLQDDYHKEKFLENMQCGNPFEFFHAYDWGYKPLFIGTDARIIPISARDAHKYDMYESIVRSIETYHIIAVFEDLTNKFTKKAGGFRMSKFKHAASKSKTTRFEFVSPSHTSSVCHRCNTYVGNPKFGFDRMYDGFGCNCTDYIIDSDLNASYNIAKKAGITILSKDGMPYPKWDFEKYKDFDND